MAMLLLCLAGSAHAIIDVNKAFTPTSRAIGQTALMSITLFNSGVNTATSAALTDTLPAGVRVNTVLTNTCSGTTGTTTGQVTLSGGVIPSADAGGNGSCEITVEVQAQNTGTWVNTIATTDVNSSEGIADKDASATLTVTGLIGITGTKVFAAGFLHGNGTQSFTITLGNNNAIPATGVGFTDTFPTTLVVASPTAVLADTCGGTITANNGSALADGSLGIRLVGWTIPANSSCSVSISVRPNNNTAAVDANQTNSIAANGVTTTIGIRNPVAISGTVRLQRGAQLAKAFNPATIASGGTASLVITLRNFNLQALTSADFTDSMPSQITVQAVGSNSCGGVLSFTPGSLTLAGGTIPAAPTPTVSSFGSCSITAVVYSEALLTQAVYTNSIPAGTISGVTYAAASANLTVRPPTAIFVSKSFNPTTRPQGGTSLLSLTLQNTATLPASINGFTDSIATMGNSITIASSPAPYNNCGGTLTATAGSTLITLAGGVIPAAGTCLIQVPVQIANNAAATARTNSVPAGNLSTTQGINIVTTTAALTVVAGASLSKSFSPATIGPSGVSRATIVINHAAGAPPFTSMALNDNLATMGAGHVVATPANSANTCGGTLTATSGATLVSLSGAGLGAGSSSCSFSFDVQAPAGTGTGNNSLPIGTLSTAEGITNAAAATAGLTRSSSGSPVTLNKSFSPVSINGGAASLLAITLANTGGSPLALTGVSLTDTFPTGMIIADIPSAQFTGSGCSGASITATPGVSSVSLSGASIAAGSTCELQVYVTSILDGNLTNDLPVGALSSQQSVTNNNSPAATLTVLRNTNIGKTFTPSTIGTGSTSLLRLSIYNSNDIARTGVNPNTLSDQLPAGLTIASATSSNSCGGTITNASGGTLSPGDTGFRLNGGSFPANSVCTITVSVTSAATGTYVNTIPAGSMTTAEGSTNVDPAQATLTVVATPTIAKAFSPTSVAVGGTSSIVFTLSNPNGSALLPGGLTSAAFSDTLLGGIVVTNSGPAQGSCAGASSNVLTAGQTSLVLSGITIAPGTPGTCTVIIFVTAPGTGGSWPNTVTGVTTAQTTAASAPATATLVTLTPPQISKEFSPTSVATGNTGTAVLTITLINPAAATVTLANPAFTDAFPTSPGQMRVHTTTGIVNTCGGTLQDNGGGALARGDVGIRLINGSIPPAGSCSIAVVVAAPQPGNYLNTSGIVASLNAGNSAAGATASLTITWVANLSVTKTNFLSTVITTNTTTYEITVTNAGPAQANGTILQDPAATGLDCVSITCSPSGGAACPTTLDIPTLQGSGLVIPTLPASSSLTFQLTCTVQATGV